MLQVRIEGYAFNSFEKITEDVGQIPNYENVPIDLKYAGTVGMVYHSIIGPMGIHVNYYDDNENEWGVLLQIGYLLFNDHSLE